MQKYQPIFDEPTPTRHIWVHSTKKIERDVSEVEYSKLTGAIIKTVSRSNISYQLFLFKSYLNFRI